MHINIYPSTTVHGKPISFSLENASLKTVAETLASGAGMTVEYDPLGILFK